LVDVTAADWLNRETRGDVAMSAAKCTCVDDGLKTDMVRILGCVKTNAERVSEFL
jgi:hypothetical protein